jgi:hypothetical protein
MRFVLRRDHLPDVTRKLAAESAKPLKGPSMSLFTVAWVKDAAERAIKTFAQAVLGALTLGGVDVLHLDWGDTLSLAGTATAISVLTSIVSVARGDTISPASAVEAPAGRHAAHE